MGLVFISLLLIGALCYNEHRQLSGSSEATQSSHFYFSDLYQCVLKPRGNAVKCMFNALSLWSTWQVVLISFIGESGIRAWAGGEE